ncbi:S8 family serine peptidase, partial [Streptomyces scabiei]
EGSHGQHVAGIIGHADNQNDKYVVGIAPEAQLIFFKDIGINGDNQIAAGIYDAVKVGADVISISLDNNLYVQDLGDADQKAIQYATDHGVVVSIAASNDGNSASVDGVWGKKRIYSPGSDAGNYQPFNSGTIPTPALSKNAITVAAENSAIGEHNEIGWFTSWGPLPDFTLKP